MKPETLKDVIRALPCDGATTLAFLGALPCALLDAHVYRSCPECGGSRKVPATEAHYGGSGGGCLVVGGTKPCPACKDAPTAIVSAALRKKAIREGWLAYHHAIHGEEEDEAVIAAALFDTGILHESYARNMGALVDAVLSVVLVHVRYAKEIVEVCLPGKGVPITTKVVGCTVPSAEWSALYDGDTIAILEEAGKEGDG